MNSTIRLVVLAIVVLVIISCSKDEEPYAYKPPTIPGGSIAKTKLTDASFRVGAAVKVDQLNDPLFANTFKSDFNQLTGEYEMKMGHIWKSPTSYDWSKADALVNFAVTNKMEVHGHALLWYSSVPEWFKNAGYDTITYENHVKNYITTIVQRYKGKVISWDVANEIFADNGTLRVEGSINGKFKDPIAFYGRCFQYARNADPAAKLFYNDYSVVIAPSKRYAIKQMVARFQKMGWPIDGIGDQFHYMVNTDKNVMKTGLNDMASTGLLIHISELDLRVNVNKSDNYVFTETEKLKQSDAYQTIVELFESIPQAQKFAITTWGVTDKSTWLTGWWHPKEYPLLFDANYSKKAAYNGFLKGLK